MPFSNYTELQSSVADWLNRGDLTNQVKDFIALGEAELRRRLVRRLVSGSITLNAGSVAIPAAADEIVMISLNTDTYRGPLKQTTVVGIQDHLERYSPTGIPRLYAVVGSNILLAPVPDASYTGLIIYREGLTALSTSAPTNNTLTRAYDAYLYASLLAAEPFLEHDTRIPIWREALDRAIAAENIKREREELGAGPAQPRQPVVFGE